MMNGLASLGRYNHYIHYINPPQGSKVPYLLTSHVRVYHGPVGFGSKNPFEIPCDCRIRAKGLIIHGKEDLEVFILLYPIPFLMFAWHRVGETQSICWLPQNVSTL